MDDSHKIPFSEAVGALLATFGIEATKPVLRGYWLGLQDLTIEAVQFAVARAIRSADRLPRPAELRKLAGEGSVEERAVNAWGDVLGALPKGSYRSIDFADRLINATIRNLGGWPSFLSRFTDAESEKWARLEFLKTYQSIASSSVGAEACAPLVGLSKATAIGGNLCAPVPVRIECDAVRMRLPCPVRREGIAGSAGVVPRVEFKRIDVAEVVQ